MDALESAGMEENMESVFCCCEISDVVCLGVQRGRLFPPFSGIRQLSGQQGLVEQGCGLRGFVLEKGGRQGV